MREELELNDMQMMKILCHYDPNEDREAYIERMEGSGHLIKTPGPHEIFIDIDTKEQADFFLEQYRRLKAVMPEIWKSPATPSKSGFPRCHIVVNFPKTFLEPWQRIAYQAALGSDPIREILNCARLQKGDLHPVLFVEPKLKTDPLPELCPHLQPKDGFCVKCLDDELDF